MMRLPFRDRRRAGRMLAQALSRHTNNPDAIVLGLPRGGVPVAYEVAAQLNLPMDIFLVRKLGHPRQEELAMGAIASGGIRVLNEDVVRLSRVSEEAIERVTQRERAELERREHAYRGDRPAVNVRDRVVILVDDGLATGSTMRAAVVALRQQEPSRIIVAVPVASPETCEVLQDVVDEIVCAATPEPFYAVGAWYEDFSETSDHEVRQLLDEHLQRRHFAVGQEQCDLDDRPG